MFITHSLYDGNGNINVFFFFSETQKEVIRKACIQQTEAKLISGKWNKAYALFMPLDNNNKNNNNNNKKNLIKNL